MRVHDDLDACLAVLAGLPVFAFTTRAERGLGSVSFPAPCALLFGAESRGLPTDVLDALAPTQRVRLPMVAGSRSLNLSNAVAVAVFEAWRQHAYRGALVPGLTV